MFKPHDFVQFKPELVERKAQQAQHGGLFGMPVNVTADSTFEVWAVNEQDVNLYEIRLLGFPWLVYSDELIPAK
jgi:hypothetical protein